MFFTSEQVQGQIISLNRTMPGHLTGSVEEPVVSTGESQESVNSFAKLLADAFNKVNDSQVKGMQLTQLMITDPQSVNINDVTTAIAEANMSLAMTKAIVDGAIKAYKEVMNLR